MYANTQAALHAAAKEMALHGLHLVPIGTAKHPALEAGYTNRPLGDVTTETLHAVSPQAPHPVSGIGVVTGSRSLYAVDGERVMLLALELEGKATASQRFMHEWDDAIEFVKARPLMDRLDVGWKESTPSGGVRWFFHIPVADIAYADWVIETLKARRSAKVDGAVHAELLLTQPFVITAPSFGVAHKTGQPWTRVSGGPASTPCISVPELHLLADALVEVGDERPPSGTSTAPLSGRAREVGIALNRKWGMGDTVALLRENGWQSVSTEADGSTEMEPVERPGHGRIRVSSGSYSMPGAVWTFSTSAEPFEAEVLHRPLDVVAVVSHNGNREAAAEALLSAGVVSLRPFSLMPRERPLVIPAGTETNRLVEQIGSALVEAPHPTREGEPFVFAEETFTGEPVSMLTVSREGSVRRWGPDELDSLILSVVQPASARVVKEKDPLSGEVTETVKHSYQHRVDSPVVDAVFPAGKPVAGLQSVRYVAESPVLTAGGVALSEPGYHAAQRALVAIPRRERAFWDDYKVPAKPSQLQAQAALDFLLDEIAVDFPFETPGDRARFIAYLLTAASRSLYGAAPGFLFDAAERGSGKSLLAALGRSIAFGSPKRQTVGYSAKDDAETQKGLVTAALAGTRAVHVDELPRGERVTSTVLSELITDGGGMEVRKLGGNTSVRIPPLLVSVCGNNALLGGDANRRFLPVRLVHRGNSLAFERSGFRHADIEAFARAERPRILAAIHTLLAHGIQNPASPPDGFGSFEGWARVVLSSLVHVTFDAAPVADLVVDGRKTFLDEQDEDGQEWAPLMVAVHSAFDGEWARVGQIRERATGTSPAVELPAELLAFTGEVDASANRRWGRALALRKDSSVRHDGVLYRFEMLRDSKKGHRFRVVALADRAADAEPLPVPTAKPVEVPTPLVNEPRREAVEDGQEVVGVEVA